MHLVVSFEGGTVLRPHFPAVVDAGGGDVGVPQSFLHLGDVGFMLQRVGRCGRPQRVRPEVGGIDLQRGGVARPSLPRRGWRRCADRRQVW